MNRFWKTLTSLRLTVALLACSVLLVFFGTLSQVDQGLWKAQQIWFRSIIVTMQHLRLFGLTFTVPIFPGGYLIGYTLFANLTAAFLKRFTWRWDKIGIHFTHAGVILLLLGQLLTDQLSTESNLRMEENETHNFTEDHLKNELAFSIDTTDGKEHVVAIPEAMIKPGQEIKADDLPFTVRVKDYQVNSSIRRRGPMVDATSPATQGVGPELVADKRPETTDMDSKNMPYAFVELLRSGQSLGTWLVTPWFELFKMPAQDVTVDGKKYRFGLRAERYYQPFTVKLLKATHEAYRGTEIPKNFKSRVRIVDGASGEAHEVDIYMNHPLRYAGLTFYQYQMGQDEMNHNRDTSTLQVVHNPGWLAPYAGCYIVAIGMFIQFRQHLTKFLGKRLAKTSLNQGGWGVWVARVAEIIIIGYAVLKFTMNLIGYNS